MKHVCFFLKYIQGARHWLFALIVYGKLKNCITITLVNFECYHDVTKVERCLSGTSQAKMSVIVTEHLIPHYFSLSFRVIQLF